MSQDNNSKTIESVPSRGSLKMAQNEFGGSNHSHHQTKQRAQQPQEKQNGNSKKTTAINISTVEKTKKDLNNSKAVSLDHNDSFNDNSQQHASSSSLSIQREHQALLEEAERVAKVSCLDGFNLLGVVANPNRGSITGGSVHRKTSWNLLHSSGSNSSNSSLLSPTKSNSNINLGAVNVNSTATSTPNGASDGAPSSSSQAAASAAGTSASSGLEDAVTALESTLAGVTTQIDAINSVFEQWSRQYLGTFEDDAASILEYHPPLLEDTSYLTSLPAEMEQLSLESLQQYLNQNSTLSHSFDQRSAASARASDENDDSGRYHTWHESISPDSVLGDNVSSNEQEFMQSLEDQIPSRFFETYFDLTDDATFQEFLVGTSSYVTTSQSDQNHAHLSEALRVPTHEILPLPPPDSFTGFLDRVEIALLQQVRSKSIAFFHETNRFGQLKEWISALVDEVQRVRRLLTFVQDKSVLAWELIPLLDQQRRDLADMFQVLEGAHAVMDCKAAIAGFLSSQDDLGAAQQIQHGRTLLQDRVKKLHALTSAKDQFAQYEQLVVANLGEELVEALLEWKSFGKSSRLQDMVQGLTLCNSLDRISRLYGNRLLDVIRMTVRTTVGEFAEEADSSVKACVTGMTLPTFLDCLDMLFEQILDILKDAVSVQGFGVEEGVDLDSVAPAAELSSKSISELLRLRKEAHSLVSLEEMKRLWDTCIRFTVELEQLSNYKATGLRSTLLAQAKAFVERQHEANMSSLVAALDSERWTQCDVSSERQAALTRLCSGRAVTSRIEAVTGSEPEKQPDAEVEGVRYKVVWSCLFLVEMLMTNIGCAAHFQSLATNVVSKVAELLRLFNSRSTILVLGAGAINSAARLKSINAKHLSLVTQCLGMIIAILPHVRAALMAQLPSKQHNLLKDLDKIKKEFAEHNEKVINKFVTIIGGIVEHGLAPRIAQTDFDSRAAARPEVCCVFLEGVSTNTRKMHQVLKSLLPPDHLQDVFSRIFAYVDQKVPALFEEHSKAGSFVYPNAEEGKLQMVREVEKMTVYLNGLAGVRPWEFQAMLVLERKLDVTLRPRQTEQEEEAASNQQYEAAGITTTLSSASTDDGTSSTISESNKMNQINGNHVDGIGGVEESESIPEGEATEISEADTIEAEES